MRRLAKELGVEAMSLYNHVANKGDVLDGIADTALSEIVLPTGEDDWKTAVRGIAISVHETLLRHPWATSLWMSRKPGPARLRYGNSLLGCFRNAGFSKDLTYHAYHIIESYILGYTFQVLGYQNVDMEQFSDIATSFLSGEFAVEYPHFTEHVRQHMEPEPGHDDVSAYELGRRSHPRRPREAPGHGLEPPLRSASRRPAARPRRRARCGRRCGGP